MLTRRPTFRCGSIDQSSTFFRIPHHNDGGRANSLIQASSHAPGSRRSRASLAFVRSMKALRKTHPLDSVDRSVIEERMLVIPYADLVLIEDEAWISYMQRQPVALKEQLSAQVDLQINEAGSSTDEPVLPHEVPGSDCVSSPPQSLLSKLRAKGVRQRKARGLMLLNVLAALYGSTTVAGKFAADVAPGLPPSLSTLIRFSSALLVFVPVLFNIVRQRGQQHSPLLKAGAELGGLLFAAALLETCGNGGVSSDAPLLFAVTVIFVPFMELCAGRQSVRNITRVASLVALSGMASLALLWETLRVLHESTTAAQYMSQLQSLPWGPLVYTGLVSSGLCSWLEIHGLRSVHASTATMVNTTIPIWGASLSFFLRGEPLDDSAMVGGSVILVASFFAQLLTSHDDENTPADDHVQGAILTSQLKFPYYTAQAKRLLLGAKLKLLSVKSLVISATSTLLSPPPLHAGSNHAAMAVQWLDIAAGLLESAIAALAYDIVHEAEHMARLAEHALQVAMAHVAMFLDIATGDFRQFADRATTIATSACSVNCFLVDMATRAKSFQIVDTATAIATSISLQTLNPGVYEFVNMASGALLRFLDTGDVSVLAERSVVCAHHAHVPVLQILLACGARSP